MMNQEVRKAGDHLDNGRTILYPTDTIWGIGCDATDENAVQRIYEIKQRSDRKSMLVLMDGISMLAKYLEQVPEKAQEIIETSRRPTTIIYPGALNLADNLVAEDGSIGVRITHDPFCRLLLNETGKPIVSTSANISGESPPRSFSEIDSRIVEAVDHVVNHRQDESASSAPSTIIRIDEKGDITVLRP